MAGILSVNPGDILQAMETQLIAKGVVPTADAIYWIMDGAEPSEKPTGKRDILFCVTRKLVKQGMQTGGGRLGMRFELLIDVRLRTIMLLDRVNASKDALIDHWNQEDAIMDALLRWFPSDNGNNSGNLLTIEGFNLDTTIVPHPDRMTPKWGASVGTWRACFLPNISQKPVG